jgi:hypothetical protein
MLPLGRRRNGVWIDAREKRSTVAEEEIDEAALDRALRKQRR